MANSKFARASRAGHRAGKPGSAAYKAAFRKAFKGRGGGGKRKAPRKTRRAARRATRAPRRKRTRMARRSRRRSGRKRGRGRGTVLTPKNIAIAIPAVVGLIESAKVVSSQINHFGSIGAYVQNLGKQAGGAPRSSGLLGTEAAKSIAPAALGAAGSFGAKIAFKLIEKPMPAPAKRILNYKIARV